MIVDIHGHVSAPSELYAYKANLLSHRGAHGRGRLAPGDDALREAQKQPNQAFGGMSHLEHLDAAGIDLQLISPRPYTMMHSEEPSTIVEWYTEETNNVIHRVCELFPDRFRGVAGLPQSPELEPAAWTKELRRAVNELGFVGCLLNPDPKEGLTPPPAGLGDRYWYPVYEALCELDVPGIIHSAGCRPPTRETYSLHFIQEETVGLIHLLQSKVFSDFPSLKLVVCHGGGAIPYQVGRFEAGAARRPGGTPFRETLRQVYFDTCLYTSDAIELLLRTVGVDRAMFGSEKPGSGSAWNPESGRWYDDIHLLIDDIDWLTDADRSQLLVNNAAALFGLSLPEEAVHG